MAKRKRWILLKCVVHGYLIATMMKFFFFSLHFLLTFFFSYYLNTLQNVYTIWYGFSFCALCSIFLKCLSSICLCIEMREKRVQKCIWVCVYLKFGNILIILMLLPLLSVMMVSMCMTTAYTYSCYYLFLCVCMYVPFFSNEHSPWREKKHKSFFSTGV